MSPDKNARGPVDTATRARTDDATPSYPANDAQATVEAFAEAIYEPADIVEIRTFPSRKQHWVTAAELPALAESTLTFANTEGEQNIYVGINPRRAKGGAKAEDVLLARCIFADIDHTTPEEAAERIRRAHLPSPTLLVNSGHGAWAYWRLAEPMTDLGLWTVAQKRLIGLLDSDKSIHDPPRIGRLPGFLNHKEGQDSVPAVIVEVDASRRYTMAALLGELGAAEAATPAPKPGPSEPLPPGQRFELSRSTWKFLASGAAEGERNAKLFAAACDMAGAGYSIGEAEAKLGDAARRCGLKDDEIAQTIRSAFSRERMPAVLAGESDAEFEAYAAPTAAADTAPAPAAAAPSTPTTPARPSQFHHTDLGNARRLIREHGADLRYDVGHRRWRVWDGSRWVLDDSGEAERRMKATIKRMWTEAIAMEEGKPRDALLAWCKKSEMAPRLAAAMDVARSELGVSISADDFDAHPWLFNVANGTVDLRTGTLRPHRREDLQTKIAPVAFKPDATCPRWLRFLNEIQPLHERQTYIQRLCGCWLTGDISEQILPILYGSGANGKSVLVDAISGVMGEYSLVAPDALLTASTAGTREHPTILACLQGRRLVIGSESEEGAHLRTQLIKRLTGDQRITARVMRGDFFEFPRTHKMVLCTNNRPRVNENTNAIWRRLRLVPFDVTIPPERQDPKLLDKLREEWPGILAWAIRGCLDWQANGMETPEDVAIATQEYQSEQDPLADFLGERCVLGEAMTVSRPDLLGEYLAWAKSAGEKSPLDKSALFERVRRVPGIGETMRRRGGNRVRVFTGIGVVNATSDYESYGCESSN